MTGHDNIAQLRHRLVLEQPIRTEDEGGTAIVTWSTVAEIWAAIEPKGRREIMKDDGFQGLMTHEVHFRYLSGVDQTMRFRFGVRLFDIRTIRDDGERRQWLTCQCEEVRI